MRLIVSLASLFVTIFYLLINKPDVNSSFSNKLLLELCILGLSNIILFWVSCSKYYKTWVRYDVLFLLSFSIVHFQFPLVAGLGYELSDPDFIWINKNVVNYGTWLSCIAICLWMLFYNLYIIFTKKIKSNNLFSWSFNLKKLDLLILVSFSVFVTFVGKGFIQGNYSGAQDWGGIAIYIYLILRAALLLRLIYFIYSLSLNQFSLNSLISESFKSLIFIIPLSIYVFLFFIGGDRGIILDVSIIVLASIGIFIRSIRFIEFLGLFLIGAFIMTLLGLGRTSNVEKRDGGILEVGYSEFQSRDEFVLPTDELAGSNRILFRAIDVVPDPYPYLNGFTMGLQVIGIFPFAGSFIITTLDIPEIFTSSSLFFTIVGQGVHRTWGEGSELLGDIYINFGEIGILFIMPIFGLFISYVTNKATYKSSIVIIILFLILTSNAIYINRDTILSPLKLLVYIFVIDWIFVSKHESRPDDN